jgi:hypothetical protein
MGVRTDWSFEPIASGLRMLLGNGKPDDLFVPTRDVRGRRVVPYRSGGRMGLRCVTQWVEFCADLAESGGLLLVSDREPFPPNRGAWCPLGTAQAASNR